MKRLKRVICVIAFCVVAMMGLSSVSFAETVEYTNNLIPKMTSNAAPSGIVTCSEASLPAWQAFDRNINHPYGGPYHTWTTTKTSGWLAYEFELPQTICKYTLAQNIYTGKVIFPKNWTFEAWDGATWIVLDTRTNITNWTNGGKKEFVFDNDQAYIKYRINITSPVTKTDYTSKLAIGELEMMAAVTTKSSPTNLAATSIDEKVNLSWDVVDGATSYNVKRSEAIGGNYKEIGTSNNSSYIDTSVISGTTYYYVVSAIVEGTESANSNEVSATPMAPTKKLKIVLEVDEQLQLSLDEDLSENVNATWNSSDTSVATVDSNGIVAALKPGNTVVTASCEEESYSESINILVLEDATDYRLAVDLKVGKKCRLTVDDNSNKVPVTWASMDSTIATVTSKGKVKAVSEGLTIITVTDADGNEIGQVYVRVRL
ncbi:MAG: Ig-like domain-containing protein [Velocimicrobium sp.]